MGLRKARPNLLQFLTSFPIVELGVISTPKRHQKANRLEDSLQSDLLFGCFHSISSVFIIPSKQYIKFGFPPPKFPLLSNLSHSDINPL